jgi:hypothetical protein
MKRFEVYEVALQRVCALRPAVERIRQRPDPSLTRHRHRHRPCLGHGYRDLHRAPLLRIPASAGRVFSRPGTG